LFPHRDLKLGPHGDASPRMSVFIQVEVPTGVEKHTNTHTHTRKRTSIHTNIREELNIWLRVFILVKVFI